MALSGWLLTFFIVAHLLGNSSIYAGPAGINAYAEQLRNLGPLTWLFRSVMLGALTAHVWIGIRVTLENRKAKPEGYARKRYLQASFASRNMIYTGLLIAAFVVFHLLHFTFQAVDPAVSRFVDSLGRHDVYRMVVLGLGKSLMTAVYLTALFFLFLHLSHGLGSSFQSLGLNSERTLPVVERAGKGFAVVILAGYASIPILVFFGMLSV